MIAIKMLTVKSAHFPKLQNTLGKARTCHENGWSSGCPWVNQGHKVPSILIQVKKKKNQERSSHPGKAETKSDQDP